MDVGVQDPHELREAIGWGDTQLKLHLARLEDHEYLLVHRLGQSHRFELAYGGDAADATRQMIGLIDVEALRPMESAVTTANRSGLKAHRSGENGARSGSGRPVVGGQSVPGRGDEIPRNVNTDADFSSLVAAVEETVVLRTRTAHPSHRSANGATLAAQG